MGEKSDDMQELVSASQAMLEHASTGAWEKVARGELRRQQLLNTLFSEPGENMDVKEVDRIIREVLQINNKLESITVAACEYAKSKTEALVTGKRAVNQYAMHSG